MNFSLSWWATVSLAELRESFLSVELIIDYTGPFTILLWALILLVPLKNIDRNDFVTSMTYLLFTLACGSFIMVIFHKGAFPLGSITQVIGIVAVMTMLSVLRWNYKKNGPVKVVITRDYTARKRTEKEYE